MIGLQFNQYGLRLPFHFGKLDRPKGVFRGELFHGGTRNQGGTCDRVRSSVRQFQVEQSVPDHVLVRVVAPDWSDADAERLRREVGAIAGGALEVRVEQVDEIPLTAAGKLKVVVNRLQQSAGVPAK